MQVDLLDIRSLIKVSELALLRLSIGDLNSVRIIDLVRNPFTTETLRLLSLISQ